MDPEETALEKVRRAKIMQFMKPTTTRPHKSVHLLTPIRLYLTVFKLESIRGHPTTEAGHHRHRSSPTNCTTTTTNYQPTSHTFIRSASINFQYSRSSAATCYFRTPQTPFRFTRSPRDTYTCTRTSTSTSTTTSSYSRKYIPPTLPYATTHPCAIATETRGSAASSDRSA